MKEIIGARLQAFAAPGSMGAVKDTRYTRCFWPKLDQPTALFAAGSSGLVIEGPPTPRNVIFPPDTVFAANTRSDCHFLREKDYVSILTAQQADNVASGKSNPSALKLSAVFIHIEQSLDDPNLKVFRLANGVMTDVTAVFEVP
jgi:hypothetical protein